jgi:eukaryotic-like serine/threonine-protein kinase
MQMTPNNWDKAKELFEAALELNPSQRASFLAVNCHEASLKQQVEKLLIDYQAAGSFLDKPALHSADETAGIEDLMINRRLGAYKLVRRLGQGGMAAVFLAVRADDEYHKEVAVKLVRPGLDSQDMMNRFRNERQTLAGLDHPNIVRLLDGGSTPEGAPFLVMEYVEGMPIDEYCDQHKLSVDDRLHLFGEVCDAVQYAHEKLVIHRDLKPSNILVMADGTPKLLDFGIAKVLNPEPSNQGWLATQTGLRCMTPAYASPEQARGKSVTTETDVYSLGVVLYELLTGHCPYRLTQHSPAEIERAICEQEPETPSTAISRVENDTSPDGKPITKTPELVSLTREGEPDKLRRRLRGDLDNIVLKSLQKEPQHRYGSVAEFSQDIDRHLQHQPVKARPSTFAYRVSSFAQRHRTEVGAAFVVLIVTFAAASFAFNAAIHDRLRMRSSQTTIQSLVLADFTNTTADPVFDGTLRQGLAVQLEQSPFLRLVPDQRVQQTLSLMGQLPDVRLTPEIARDLCQRTQSSAFVDGSIAVLGSQYVLGLKAVSCHTGDTLAEEQITADSKERVLKALGDATSKLRTKLGESLSTVQKFDTPIEQATTPSLEALQAYSLGKKAKIGGEDAASVPLFQRAIRLDPNFAMAYASLGTSYRNLGERTLAWQNEKKAFDLRERVTERERFYIESHYYGDAGTGDLEKESQVYELWAQTYPADSGPLINLAGTSAQLGRYDNAVAEAREYLHLDTNPLSYSMLIDSYVRLNRLEEARATAVEAQAKKFDSPALRFWLYQLAFLQDDAAGMAQQVAWATGKPGMQHTLLAREAMTAAYSGRLVKAREFSHQAVALAEREANRERAASYEADAALREALFGNATEARKLAVMALGLSAGGDEQYAAALALTLLGDTGRGEALANDLAKRFPEDTIVQSNYLPTLRAQLALSRSDSSKAIEALQAATPYELGLLGINTCSVLLHPIYVRGQAFLMSHQGREAAAEFQKILDHRGIVLNSPIGALAHLQIGRAYAMQRDTAKAKAAYQDFLTLWKDADPDIPILVAAKAEYAKLK